MTNCPVYVPVMVDDCPAASRPKLHTITTAPPYVLPRKSCMRAQKIVEGDQTNSFTAQDTRLRCHTACGRWLHVHAC